jgi:hypothetical protein
MKLPHFIALVVAVIAFDVAGAQAQAVSADDPRQIAKLISDKGYQAELVDTDASPRIRSSDSGIKFLIFFLNCTDGKKCATLQFYTGFGDTVVPLEKINEWNSGHRFGRSYLDDERDPVLEMDLNLDAGGVSSENFLDNFTLWLDLMQQFRTFVAENSADAAATKS